MSLISIANLLASFHFILILLSIKLATKESQVPYKISSAHLLLVHNVLIYNCYLKKRMAKNIGFLICLLIMALDVVAGILGIEAEMAQNKVRHLKVWFLECRDPSYQAFKLGLAAAILLALAHIIGNLLGGCVCLWSREEFGKASANRQLAMASLFFSWIILAVGFSMLMIGAMANSRSRKGIKGCGLSNHRVLSIGGILCFIHGLFTVAYYVSATASARDHSRHQPSTATA